MLHKKSSFGKNILIYGKHAVISALRNPARKHKNLYITKDLWQEIENQINSANFNLVITNKQSIAELAPKNSVHQNILLETSPVKNLDLEDLIDISIKKNNSCVLILDQVQDPHNVGAIIRSAAAFSVDAVIIPENNSPKENNTIVKCSAGAIDTIPLIYVTNIANSIKQLQKAGYWVTGLDGAGTNEIGPAVFNLKTVLVMGSEEKGIRKLVRENCDYLAKINISENVESLNVASAASIALYAFQQFLKSYT